MAVRDMARACDVPPERLAVLIRAGEALGLLYDRKGRVRLTRGARHWPACPD